MAENLGFSPGNLIEATFEQEAIGDLMSEQGLLCGGLFTLMEWTMESMRKAGVPEALIREECLTETKLLMALVSQKGPGATLEKISEAAQCGTSKMHEAFSDSDVYDRMQKVFQRVIEHDFPKDLKKEQDWKPKFEHLQKRLKTWDQRWDLT